MAAFTQAEIDALIACSKHIAEAPKPGMRVDGSHRRNGARLTAADGTRGTFLLFVRQHVEWQENFSVGLRYEPQDGRQEITLIRCNGPHGVYNRGNNDFDPEHPHWHPHIHKATEEALDSGFAAEKNATRTSEFTSLPEAVRYIVRAVGLDTNGIQDIQEHFGARSQADFDFGDE